MRLAVYQTVCNNIGPAKNGNFRFAEEWICYTCYSDTSSIRTTSSDIYGNNLVTISTKIQIYWSFSTSSSILLQLIISTHLTFNVKLSSSLKVSILRGDLDDVLRYFQRFFWNYETMDHEGYNRGKSLIYFVVYNMKRHKLTWSFVKLLFVYQLSSVLHITCKNLSL